MPNNHQYLSKEKELSFANSNSEKYFAGAEYMDHIISKASNPHKFLQNNECYKAITYHPNNSIVAILISYTIETLSRRSSCSKQFVRYYNIETLQCIDQTTEFDARYSCDLALSPDGFTLIIVLADKCVKIPVSFAIKEKCIYSLCVLNQLKNNNVSNLPNDISHYIIKTLCNKIIFG